MRLSPLAFVTLVLLWGLAIGIAAVLLASPAHPMDVTYDTGGSINKRIEQIKRLNAAGEQIRILGDCRSACTMYLGADNVCVAPNASLWFHGAKPYDTKTPGIEERLNERIASMYPDFVAKRFLRTWRYMNGDAKARMPGRWFIERGIPECS